MVSDTEDPVVVTARIQREMRYAREEREAREEAETARARLAVEERQPVTETAELQVATPAEIQAEAETSFRHGRLAVVAVIVLVLFWAWVQERRNARKERGVQNGRYGQ